MDKDLFIQPPPDKEVPVSPSASVHSLSDTLWQQMKTSAEQLRDCCKSSSEKQFWLLLHENVQSIMGCQISSYPALFLLVSFLFCRLESRLINSAGDFLFSARLLETDTSCHTQNNVKGETVLLWCISWINSPLNCSQGSRPPLLTPDLWSR